jgi:hypothetical protein
VRIQEIVKKKAGWVVKKLTLFDEIAHFNSRKEFINGETFLFLGRKYRLKIEKNREEYNASIIGQKLVLTMPSKTNRGSRETTSKEMVLRWYREMAPEVLGPIISKFGKRIGINDPRFFIKNQFKRWASCTSKKQVIFNFRIIMSPMSQIEYVVAHELCHIKHKNHTPEFWGLLGRILPDYKKRKEALRDEGWQYDI